MSSRVESYVEELGQNLKVLPVHERLEQLEETRAHLDGLTESFRELGDDETTAQEKAVAQFGAVKTVALELTAAVRRGTWRHALGVAAIAMGIQGLFGGILSTIDLPWVLSLQHKTVTLWVEPISVVVFYAIAKLAVCGLLSGVLLRCLAPGRTLRPTLIGLVVSWVYFLISVVHFAGSQWGMSTFWPFLINPTVLFGSFTSGAWCELRQELRRRQRRSVA